MKESCADADIRTLWTFHETGTCHIHFRATRDKTMKSKIYAVIAFVISGARVSVLRDSPNCGFELRQAEEKEKDGMTPEEIEAAEVLRVKFQKAFEKYVEDCIFNSVGSDGRPHDLSFSE